MRVWWLLLLAGRGLLAAEPIEASSVFDDRYRAEYAVDGDPATRWASRSNLPEPQHLTIDLGDEVSVDRLTIVWEAAYAVDYEIQVGDGETWSTLRRVTDGRGGTVTLERLAGRGRWLRLVCRAWGPHALYSIWEISSPDPELQAALAGATERLAAARARTEAAARATLAEALEGRPVIFAVRAPSDDGHWYANFGFYAEGPPSRPFPIRGGQLCRLEPATGQVTVLLDDPGGAIRDPQLDYDAGRIVFAWLRSGEDHYHLWTMDLAGGDRRQLTFGEADDIEPTWLPDGSLAFVSSRCRRWVNCWATPVATLYRCAADGSDIRPLSANIEHDNTPWPLPDGRLLYMRWEYIDRSQVHYHHLWTVNPDGTGQMVYYGNQQAGVAMLDAKPIPGARQVVCVWSPGHGKREHEGRLALIDPAAGPDEPRAARVFGRTEDLRDPYPLGANRFLAARGAELLVLDDRGHELPVYRLPENQRRAGLWLHEPRPVEPRPREAIIPDRVTPTAATGTLVLANVYEGRRMTGVRPGDIRRLLVLEALPKPINYTGGMDPLSYGGTFTLERVVGTVPVEPDGSAHLELPAHRSFFFVALDERNLAVKRMQSFVSVQPGETTSCVGCHEQRTRTTLPRGSLQALARPPSRPEPVAGVPDVLDFPRDVQPLLDRHCLPCHDWTAHDRPEGPRAGGVVLAGDRGPMFSHSYFTLTWRRQFVDGRNDPRSNLPPRAIGSAASPLLAKLSGAHHGVRLEPREVDVIRLWIETGATYPGTYGALGGGTIGGYRRNQLVEHDLQWPEARAVGELVKARCAGCHAGPMALPTALSDELGLSFWRPDWNDPRLRHSRHLVWNLTRPERSLMLLAPLPVAAGGYGVCGDGGVLSGPEDEGYRVLLALAEAGRRKLAELRRFDQPDYRPPAPYLRELVRYGVLPRLPEPTEPLDCYDLDRRYWRSFWLSP